MSREPQHNEKSASQLSPALLLAIAAFEVPLNQAINNAKTYLTHEANASQLRTHESTYHSGPGNRS